MDKKETISLCRARIILLKDVLEMRIAEIKENLDSVKLDLVNEELDAHKLIIYLHDIKRLESGLDKAQYDIHKAKGEIKELKMRISELNSIRFKEWK